MLVLERNYSSLTGQGPLTLDPELETAGHAGSLSGLGIGWQVLLPTSMSGQAGLELHGEPWRDLWSYSRAQVCPHTLNPVACSGTPGPMGGETGSGHTCS